MELDSIYKPRNTIFRVILTIRFVTIYAYIVLRIFSMIISHAALSSDTTRYKYGVISVIPEPDCEILKSILIAQNFVHLNVLYVFDKTFTFIFLCGMGERD